MIHLVPLGDPLGGSEIEVGDIVVAQTRDGADPRWGVHRIADEGAQLIASPAPDGRYPTASQAMNAAQEVDDE